VMHGYTVVAGLGGRAITTASLRQMCADAVADRLEPLTFLDLDHELVARELRRRSGPSAENMLRDLGLRATGVTGAGIG
jgi:pyruvate ferredoxin oxidoreductase alpha subunit